MKIKLTVLMVLITTMTGCALLTGVTYDGPFIKITGKLNSGKMMVEGFTLEGDQYPPHTKSYLDNRLYDLLYVSGRYDVVRKGDVDEKNEIKFLLKAELILTSASMIFDIDSERTLSMSLRIYDSESGEIAGLVTTSCKYKGKTQKQIDILLQKCIDKLTGVI